MKRDNKINRYQVFNNDTAGGVLLIIAAAMAMIVANSPLSLYYNMLIDIPVRISIGDFEIAKPLLLWINDGLMVLFFFVVGLEIKRELVLGDLRDPRAAAPVGVGRRYRDALGNQVSQWPWCSHWRPAGGRWCIRLGSIRPVPHPD